MPVMDAKQAGISLITRTSTINQGNQALSVVWRDYLAERYPQKAVRLFERVPTYLRRYTVSSFEGASDSVEEFDRIAKSLVEKASEKGGGIDPSVWNVSLDMAQRRVVRFHRLRQILKLRSRFGVFNLGLSAYLNRLHHILMADLVVVNPAGEFHSSSVDTALLYLLEARCAQLAGCKTAIVNLSFEVDNPTVVGISNHVFSHCEVVEFRDIESCRRLSAQGDVAGVIVLPDAVVLSPVNALVSDDAPKGVGLAINGPQIVENGLVEEVHQFVSELAKRESVTFISNEWATDRPYWSGCFDVKGVESTGYGLDFDDYARFLAGFSVVVSSRLHTCVLGMLSGAVVVPVECGTFKLSGFFEQIGMPNEPVRIGSDGWRERLIAKIEEVTERRRERLKLQSDKISQAQERLRLGLDDVFKDSVGGL